jgi:hypothetical protein
MPTFKIDLSKDTFDRLAEMAFQERRPIPLQIEVLVMRALGLWGDHGVTGTVAQDGPAEAGERYGAAHDR